MTLPPTRSIKLWLALLYEIDTAGGEAQPATLYPRMRAYFPEITDADIGQLNKRGNNWTNRIQWVRQLLVVRGCLDGNTRGVWRITPLGKHWLTTYWQGTTGDYSTVPQPPLLQAQESTTVTAPPPTIPTTTKATSSRSKTLPPTPLTPVADPIDQLCHSLEESQRQSSTPRLFEQHLTEAFKALGFEATHIGGSSETDVFVRAALGPRSYSAVIDAKTTRNGKVIDSQINFHAIEAHRQARAADFAAVIGVDFSNGQLQKFADQSKVTLVTTRLLVEVLRLHARIPFNLLELRDVFVTPGRAEMSMQTLRERHQQRARHWDLLVEIIDTIGQFAPPKVENLWYVLMAQKHLVDRSSTTAPALDDVVAAVTFLSSRALHIIEEVPGSNGAFQLVVSPIIARQYLTALAQFAGTEHANADDGTRDNVHIGTGLFEQDH